MANTSQIWKELQANFTEPKMQYACSFTGKYVYKEFLVTICNFPHPENLLVKLTQPYYKWLKV